MNKTPFYIFLITIIIAIAYVVYAMYTMPDMIKTSTRASLKTLDTHNITSFFLG